MDVTKKNILSTLEDIKYKTYQHSQYYKNKQFFR